MKFKSELFDENAVRRALVRIAHEITERNDGIKDLVLVGIKSRGVPLAKIIAANISGYEGAPVETRELTSASTATTSALSRVTLW